MGLPPVRIDLLTELSGLTFGEAWPGRTRADFGPVVVDVIGREAFIKNKRATGRARDLGDIEALRGVVVRRLAELRKAAQCTPPAARICFSSSVQLMTRAQASVVGVAPQHEEPTVWPDVVVRDADAPSEVVARVGEKGRRFAEDRFRAVHVSR